MYRDNRLSPIPHPLNPTRADSGRQHRDTETPRSVLKVLPVRIAAAVSSLASEVLTGTAGHVDGAAVLDRLRRRMNATHAVLWICDNQGGRRVLVSGRGSAAQAAPLDFDHGGVAIQRLRRAGTVLCCLGEVTGFEDLVPDDVHSFVVAAGTSGDDCTPVLLLGWTLPVPPCVTADAVPLQIAATLLASTLAPRFGTDRQVDGYVDTSHNVTEARRAQSLLREVTRKLVTAQEGERARIARELHDDVGQQVALLVSHLEMITPDRDLRPELDHARESLQAIASALTNLSHGRGSERRASAGRRRGDHRHPTPDGRTLCLGDRWSRSAGHHPAMTSKERPMALVYIEYQVGGRTSTSRPFIDSLRRAKRAGATTTRTTGCC